MRTAFIALAVATVLLQPRPADAYSVLAHQSMVDGAWDGVIVPMLRRRFPQATAEQILEARAYAYGGSVIQDLGYYPFGSALFTNLVHYVRSGDFVEALIVESQDAREYAFALGALAHYTSDTIGHPDGVNPSVPLIYPKVRERHGVSALYVDDPRRHVRVEFAFDVVQAATGRYVSDAFRDFIGFEVARPLLARAFLRTYGLTLKQLFTSEDLAIGTYRYAISTLIPEVTRVAWREKQDEILKVTPGATEETFIYRVTRRDYEDKYGTSYRKPGFLTRLLVSIVRVLPKIGPLSVLAFKAPTPEAERLFTESLQRSRDRYLALLRDAGDGGLQLPNADFDTGALPSWGDNRLADETCVDLLDRLAADNFTTASPELRRAIASCLSTMDARPAADDDERALRDRARPLLARLTALG